MVDKLDESLVGWSVDNLAVRLAAQLVSQRVVRLVDSMVDWKAA